MIDLDVRVSGEALVRKLFDDPEELIYGLKGVIPSFPDRLPQELADYDGTDEVADFLILLGTKMKESQ